MALNAVRLLTLLVILCGAGGAQAAAVTVPTPLEPWRTWVLDRHPQQACPPVFSDAAARTCAWISTLALSADANGAQFTLDVDLFATADTILPGGPGAWPMDVTVTPVGSDRRPATVTRAGDQPRLRLPAGRYRIAGRIAWPRLPEAIAVPRHHGLLTLTVDDRPVPQPLVEGERLWLARAGETAATTEDSIQVRVYRRIIDGVPLSVETTLDLAVGGGRRVETLGRALPEDFAITQLDSPVPARIDADGSLRVQVEPGNWQIRFTGRALRLVDTLHMRATTPNWPRQEIWGFAAARDIRTVTIAGAAPVDLSQTGAPFQDLPGFLMTPENAFRLVEEARGDPNPAPADYRLARTAWLSFAGDRLVLEDRIDATLTYPARLAATFVPGRIEVDGVPQLVTRGVGDAPGIELPQGNHRILAVSELERDALGTVLGWSVDAAAVEATLQLPPAWRLLWTSGVDHAPTAWVAQWNVWDLFLVLVTVFAAARLLGTKSALLAAVTLIIVYHEPGAPGYAWIILLTLLAGTRISRPGLFRVVLGGLYSVTLVVTLAATVSFAMDGFRQALYPQLEPPGQLIGRYPEPAFEASLTAPHALAGAMTGSMREDDARTAERTLSKGTAHRPPPDRYSPDLRVQTGPAVPQWRWTATPLRWDGPVSADQPFAFALAPPWLTRTLYAAGPVLLLALFGLFALAHLPASVRVPHALAQLAGRRGAAPGAALLIACASLSGGLTSTPAHAAEFPSPELLTELETRLIAPPDCMPDCASVERATVQLDGANLRVELALHAEVAVAVPVLRAGEAWQPATLTSGGRPATVTRDDAGRLLVAVPPGITTVVMVAPVEHLDRFELVFPTQPGQVTVSARDWDAFGLEDGQLRGSALQFARQAQGGTARAAGSLRSDPVSPYYAVERELRFGIEWRATTTIRRIAPAVGGIPFEVALLPDESVMSGQVTVAAGRVSGILAADQQEQSYESTLAETATLTLTAGPLQTATERWTLVPSNVWQVTHAGVPPLKSAPDAAPGPRFQPLPGETLTLNLLRPAAVPGDSITVERVALAEEPGRRMRRTTLTLTLRASQGGTFPIVLPDDARVLQIEANGRPEPIPVGAGPLPLPVVPGSQSLTVAWEAPNPVALRTTTSLPALPTSARNVNLTLALPAERWLLLVGGPALGPAVTWWSILALVLLIAIALARVPGLPLRKRDALLAGLGMSLCNLPGALVTAVWLLAMLARRRAVDRLTRLGRYRFNALQTLLAAFSVIALGAIAASVPQGLIGAPDMYIDGNGSWAQSLRWYQDRADTALPNAWVISLPIWVYRLLMLAWSLWLAFTLIRWVRWAWESYATGGAWRRRSRATGGNESDRPSNA